MQTAFRLGDWVVRPQRSVIECGDQSVHLKPKSMAVLERLAQAGGEVVSRENLFNTVWPGAVVSDDTLTQCIVELRKAVGDTARDAQFIETIPKKGFRLVPPVQPAEEAGTTYPGAAPNEAGAAEKSGVPANAWWPNRAVPWLAGAVLVSAALIWYQYSSAPPDRNPVLVIEDSNSIAVLPFADLSPGGDQEYFADGLTEELLNRLARLDDLLVTGRTSSFYFKGRDEDPATIRDALGVAYFLEGSVRKTADQLRITAQLVDTSNGFQIWAETFDRPYADIFAIQDEIAEAVSTALSITLSVGELGRLPGGTTNLEAYNEYLLGQARYREFSQESIQAAMEHFARAAELDPEYALAWERIADIYVSSMTIGFPLPEWVEKSAEALDRAIQLAPDSTAVLQTLIYRLMFLQEWSEIERIARLHPNPETTDHVEWIVTYAQALGMVDKAARAIELLERARRLDPLSGLVAYALTHNYVQAGRFDESLKEAERGYELGEYLSLVSISGFLAALSGDDEQVIRDWFPRALEYFRASVEVNQAMFEKLGDSESALAWLRQHFDQEISPATSHATALWAGRYGDADLSLGALRLTPVPVHFWTPLTSGARSLPGFRDLVTEKGMVDYWREFGWGEHCQPLGESDFECR